MPEGSNREIEIFGAALERSPAERAAFLGAACGSDADLRGRLEALLHAHDNAGKFLPGMASEATLTMESSPVTEKVGDCIGRYKIRERLGEGGCGVVYVAEQEEPMRRRVALKIIKLGMDTKSVIARFEAERQALAMMDHPNIAKVFDAGATKTGRPYFVMELVRGIRITEYCDQHKLSTGERLDLFIKVCQAVQHAHQKGIIHRDLKPSNILVTLHDGVPVPKIIDFGIAKATEGRLTEQTVYTELHQFIGTPAYMSPEQAEMSGLDIDTRSDIYSLGVLLYELLTGGTPFDGKELLKSGLDAMRKTIREQEPLRPSTRLSNLMGQELTIAAQRRDVEAPRLVNLIRGDIDWIVMKCLEKDRTRRYESASGLAADLKRHLSNEPVVARPPTTAYRIQKAIRRNKLAFGAAAAVMLTLGLGVVASTWQAVRATRAEREQSRLAESEGRERLAAQASEKLALSAKNQAEALAYAADMNLAQRALLSNNLGEARQLLELHRPPAGQESPSWEWRYLWAQSRGDAPQKVWQFADFLTFMQNSDDDHWLAVNGEKSGLSVWDISNPRAMKKVADLGGQKMAFAFAPKDALYAIGVPVADSNPKQYQITLSNAATKTTVKEIPLGEDQPVEMQFTSDGSKLVLKTQHLGFKLRVLRVPDGTTEGLYTSPPERSAPVSDTPVNIFDHDTACAISGDELQVFDLRTMKERWSTKGEPAKEGVRKATAAVLSADRKSLYSLEMDIGERPAMWIQQRDMATGKPLNAQMWELSPICFDLQFLDDGKTFVTANEDQTLQMWDISDPSRLAPKGDPFRGHTGPVTCLTLLHDGKTMFSGGADGTVYAWDLTAARGHAPYKALKDAAKGALAFTSDGKGLMMMDEEGRFYQARGFDINNRKLLVDTGGKPEGCQWNNDGQLVTARGGTFKLWDYHAGKLIREFGSYKGRGAVKSVSTDGKDVIVADFEARLYRQWDLTSFTEKGSWPTASSNLEYRNCVSPDHRLLLTSDLDGMLTVRDLVKGTETKKQLDAHDVIALKFSRDGKLFAASSMAGYAMVFDMATMEKVAKVGDLRTGIFGLEFSPDNRQLVTHESALGKTQLWDIQTQRELLTLAHPAVWMPTALFSPDGRYLAGSGTDDEYVWEAPTWEEIQAAERAQHP